MATTCKPLAKTLSASGNVDASEARILLRSRPAKAASKKYDCNARMTPGNDVQKIPSMFVRSRG